MNTLTTTQAKPSALAAMSNRVNVEPAKLLSTLKETVFKGATDNELLALVVVANEYRLNPFLREIYAFPGRNGAGIVPIVSIDGWCKIMNSQADFDGIEFAHEEGEGGKPLSCTATVHIKNRSHPVRVTEFFSECFRNTDPWKQMPRRMLRHKALIQAARVAFGFSGIFDEDEGRDVIRNVQSEPVKPSFALPSKPETIEAVATEAPKRRNAKREEPVSDASDTQKEPEAPSFEADTPQKQILEVLAANNISEKDYIAYLREKHGYTGKSLVLSMTDKEAEACLWDMEENLKGLLKDASK